MTLNESKLTAMVEVVMNVFYPAPTREICDRKQYEDEAKSVRTALTPFCMELTDEEIKEAIINECISDPDYDHWITGDREKVTHYFNRPVFQHTGIFIKPSTIIKMIKFVRDGK